MPQVTLAARRLHAAGALAMPKNGGIVFDVYLGSMADDAAKSAVTVEVRSQGTVVAGELRTVGKLVSSRAQWQWRPAADLPVGPLEVKVGRGDLPASEIDDTVVIEDRVVVSITPSLSVAPTRKVFGDPLAPRISCSDPGQAANGIGGCGSAPSSMEIASRAVVGARVEVAPSAGPDQVYFQPTVRVFGRRGGIAGESQELVGWSTQAALVDGELDEYCAEPTTLSFVDGTEARGSAICVKRTIATGTPPVDEETAYVHEMLTYCENPVFPPGTSADDPTGRSGNDSGCTMTPRSRAALGLPLAIAFAALVVRRRRRVSSASCA